MVSERVERQAHGILKEIAYGNMEKWGRGREGEGDSPKIPVLGTLFD